MPRYLIQRILAAIPALLGVVTLVFFLMRVLPGDPVAALAVLGGGSAADRARLRAEYGLDRPLHMQYLSYLADLMRGDWGRSIFTRQAVRQIVAQQAPHTIALAVVAMGAAIGLGLPLGVLGAAYHGGWPDRLALGFSVLTVSVPAALLGLLLILLFSLTLRWLPATGQGSPAHLLMPAAVMGLVSAGSIVRIVRTELLEIRYQDYINTARAKGLNEFQILIRHMLPNAIGPILTLIGLQFGFMLGGAAITESIFARQGLGRTLVDAILYQDYPVVQGVIVVSALLYILVNLLVDLAHCYLNPRICHR